MAEDQLRGIMNGLNCGKNSLPNVYGVCVCLPGFTENIYSDGCETCLGLGGVGIEQNIGTDLNHLLLNYSRCRKRLVYKF